MARQREKPIPIPEGVEITINGTEVKVKGPKGELVRKFHPFMTIERNDNTICVKRRDDSKFCHSLQGLTRTLIINMIKGVTEGYTKELVVEGMGYRAQMEGKNLVLLVGYSHPVKFEPPNGITIEVPKPQEIIVKGIDKELVGNVAAKIRAIRPPEPYKGKGIRYRGEQIRRKQGKRAV